MSQIIQGLNCPLCPYTNREDIERNIDYIQQKIDKLCSSCKLDLMGNIWNEKNPTLSQLGRRVVQLNPQLGGYICPPEKVYSNL